jgi:DNA-binding XRE family transcriptional regulator
MSEKGPEEIRQEIEETREELGDTVAAVAEKTDVKKQAKAKLELAKQNPTPLAIAGSVVGLLVLWRLLRR